MLYVTYALNFLLMIAMPLALGWYLARRFGLGWRLFAVGAVTFVLSQVFHIPLNAGLTLAFRQGLLPSPPEQWHLLFNATVLGFTAGICEEGARYFVLRTSLRTARSWREALMFGAGHGGIEAIILGVLVGVSYVNLVLLRLDPNLLSTLSPEQLQTVRVQADAYWSAPVIMSLLGAVERVFALCAHLSLAVMVMQVFLRGQMRWLFAAIAWHWLINGVAVYSAATWGALPTEGLLAIAALISLGIVYALRQPDLPGPALPSPTTSQPQPQPQPARPTAEEIDRSRYNT